MKDITILCVDDCETTQALIKAYMEKEGFKLLAAKDYGEAMKLYEKHNPELIVLDLILPDIDGMEILRKLREQDIQTPIIMLSGRGEDIDRIIGIEAGADDYIAKPFHPRELTARTKAVLKRVHISGATAAPATLKGRDILKSDVWLLDRNQFQAFDHEGNSLDLTTGEFRILERLMLAPKRALEREQLFDVLYSYDMEASDRTVDIKITRIRAKIGDDPRKPRYIKTIRNVGYMYIGPIET